MTEQLRPPVSETLAVKIQQKVVGRTPGEISNWQTRIGERIIETELSDPAKEQLLGRLNELVDFFQTDQETLPTQGVIFQQTPKHDNGHNCHQSTAPTRKKSI